MIRSALTFWDVASSAKNHRTKSFASRKDIFAAQSALESHESKRKEAFNESQNFFNRSFSHCAV
jgi:hypothetical protein